MNEVRFDKRVYASHRVQAQVQLEDQVVGGHGDDHVQQQQHSKHNEQRGVLRNGRKRAEHHQSEANHAVAHECNRVAFRSRSEQVAQEDGQCVDGRQTVHDEQRPFDDIEKRVAVAFFDLDAEVRHMRRVRHQSDWYANVQRELTQIDTTNDYVIKLRFFSGSCFVCFVFALTGRWRPTR